MSRRRPTLTSENGVRVFPPTSGEPYWTLRWLEGERRRETSGGTDQASALAKAAEIDRRLAHEFGDRSLQPSSMLIDAWVDPSRIQTSGRTWGPKHAREMKRLMDAYLRPQVKDVTANRISKRHLQAALRATTTRSEAERLLTAVRTLVKFASGEGWITSPIEPLLHNLGAVARSQHTAVAGESTLFVRPELIPDHQSVDALAKSMTAEGGHWWYELMVNLAAYAGPRLGELLDLDVEDIDLDAREVRIDYQCHEVGGQKKRELPKGRKQRTTVYPIMTPEGYPLAEMMRKRVEELSHVSAQEFPDGSKRRLLFPSPRGGWWTQSNFGARLRRPAQTRAGWPSDTSGEFLWDWHSLRHVFCSWQLSRGADLAAVSIAAGHANSRITLEMYVGASKGALKRLADLG